MRGGIDGSALRGIDIFSGLSEADLAALAAKMRARGYRPGEAIFRESEAGEELFVVASGLVSISVSSQDGEDIELSRVGGGAFFGEMAILERAPRSATCTAVETTECLVLEAADFEALLVEAPSAAVGVLERMLAIAAGRLLQDGLLPFPDGPVGRRRQEAGDHRLGHRPVQPALPRGLLRAHPGRDRSARAPASPSPCSTWTASAR